jgi:hypothetical protein
LTDEEEKKYEEIGHDLETVVGILRFQIRQNLAYSQMDLHEMAHETSLEMNDETLEENTLAF